MLNNPDDNSIDKDMRENLIEKLLYVNSNKNVKYVVLRGANGFFSKGQDKNETANMGLNEAKDWIQSLKGLYDAIRDLDKPSIAVIEGEATAVSLQMALLCDIRIATRSTIIGMPELKMGLSCILGVGIMSNLISDTLINRLIMLDGSIEAETAKRWGLITTVIDGKDLNQTIKDTCNSLDEICLSSLKRTKDWYRTLTQSNYDLMFLEAKKIHAEMFSKGLAYKK